MNYKKLKAVIKSLRSKKERLILDWGHTHDVHQREDLEHEMELTQRELDNLESSPIDFHEFKIKIIYEKHS